VKGARLAYAPRQFLDLVDPEVEAPFRDVVRRLREAGAEIVEVDLGDDFGALTQTATWGIFFHEKGGDLGVPRPPRGPDYLRSDLSKREARP